MSKYNIKAEFVSEHEILDAIDVLEGAEACSSRIGKIAKDLESDRRYDGEISTCRIILNDCGWNA